ncbi:MAG: hypothetical protein J3R72DRAFT_439962 [Linnemannia gamsii]|nr:MAG: hypothetical protein J3R72DRAFT_439962 [Linnemannia gamsii]
MPARPAPRPPAPKPPAPKPDPNPIPMPVPRPPAPKPVPIPVPVPVPVPAPRPNPNPTRPIPPIIIVPGPGGHPVQTCIPVQTTSVYNACPTCIPESTTSVYNACPTGIAQPSETVPVEKSNKGAVIGGVIGGLIALVAMIVAGFFVARWRRQRREMNDVETFPYHRSRSISGKTENDPEVGAASVGTVAGAAGVAASTTSTAALGGVGGVGESEQVQARSSVALPLPPASPTTTIGYHDDPFGSSQVKVHLDDEKYGGFNSGAGSTRPGTPVGPESLLLPPSAHQHQR